MSYERPVADITNQNIVLKKGRVRFENKRNNNRTIYGVNGETSMVAVYMSNGAFSEAAEEIVGKGYIKKQKLLPAADIAKLKIISTSLT